MYLFTYLEIQTLHALAAYLQILDLIPSKKASTLGWQGICCALAMPYKSLICMAWQGFT